MDVINFNHAQRYFDEESHQPLQLCFDNHTIEVEGIQVSLEGIPVLKNETNGKLFYPVRTTYMIKYFVEKTLKRNEKRITISRSDRYNARYSFAEKFNFLYSDVDYEYIPGLTRPWEEGYLTPVFFNMAVLNKYIQHPGYHLDLFAQTYGDIRCDKKWQISFGINRNKKVIMWLGDIARLPESEIYYLRSENRESDHDIHSEFYNAQIETEFADLSPLHSLISQRKILNEKIFITYGWYLFKLEGEISKIIENLHRPVFWEDKHVGPAIESLNMIFVESLNIIEIKNDLRKINPGLDTKSLGSLKTFEHWVRKRLKVINSSEYLCPFFVLYDYRILTCHLIPDADRKKALEFINSRLSLDNKNVNNELIFDTLIGELLEQVNFLVNL